MIRPRFAPHEQAGQGAGVLVLYRLTSLPGGRYSRRPSIDVRSLTFGAS
jgi:hypothetical protein